MSIGKLNFFIGGMLAASMAGAELVDPTLPIDVMPPAPEMASTHGSGISVSMILMRGDEAIALVSGRYVRVNETVGAAKVISIGRNYIELKQDGGNVKHYLTGFGSRSAESSSIESSTERTQ